MKNKTMTFLAAASMMVLASCGGNGSAGQNDSTGAESTDMSEQPVESGQYDVTSYDITGKDARKGAFDGRLLIALSPEQSALYVYENGNRTKINYALLLEKPFEKTDSNYVTTDSKGRQVTMTPDSTGYVLKFERGESTMSFNVDRTPRSTGTAMSVLEQITKQQGK